MHFHSFFLCFFLVLDLFPLDLRVFEIINDKIKFAIHKLVHRAPKRQYTKMNKSILPLGHDCLIIKVLVKRSHRHILKFLLLLTLGRELIANPLTPLL